MGTIRLDVTDHAALVARAEAAEAERDERQAEAASMAEALRAAEEENKRLREIVRDIVACCGDALGECPACLNAARAALRGEGGA